MEFTVAIVLLNCSVSETYHYRKSLGIILITVFQAIIIHKDLYIYIDIINLLFYYVILPFPF